jgi:hypothetical protein
VRRSHGFSNRECDGQTARQDANGARKPEARTTLTVCLPLDQTEPPQAGVHGLLAHLETIGQTRGVGTVLANRLAHQIFGHEQLGREHVGLALKRATRFVDLAAPLRPLTPRMQDEVADFVGDCEPSAALAATAAVKHDRVAITEGFESGFAGERFARLLYKLEIESADHVAQ